MLARDAGRIASYACALTPSATTAGGKRVSDAEGALRLSSSEPNSSPLGARGGKASARASESVERVADRDAPQHRRPLGEPRRERGDQLLAVAVHDHDLDESIVEQPAQSHRGDGPRQERRERDDLVRAELQVLLERALGRAHDRHVVPALAHPARRSRQRARTAVPFRTLAIKQDAHVLRPVAIPCLRTGECAAGSTRRVARAAPRACRAR